MRLYSAMKDIINSSIGTLNEKTRDGWRQQNFFMS